MNAISSLLTGQLDIWTSAETEKKSGRGRTGGNGVNVYGIQKLRELILELAVRGKLVPQDPNDEPAGELLKRIQAEKAKLVVEGKIKKDKPLPPISDEEKPFELPLGWEWVRLGLIGDWGSGATPLRSISSYYGGNTSWFKSGELTADFIDSSEETITDLALKECSLRLNQPGDVLIAMYGATIGKAAILKIPGTTNQAVCACTPNSGIFNRYLLILLKALKSNFIGQGAGGAQPNISREKIIATIAALPPTNEQRRIVTKVDELMALCDQLETQHINAAEAHEKLVSHLLGTLTQSQNADDFSVNWQRIPAHFDTLFTTEASIDALKQTLLQLAVMGKLVPQDPDDEPASELLKRIQAEKTKLIAEGKIKKDKSLELTTSEERPLNLPLCWTTASVENVSECLDNLRVPINKEVREQRQGDVPYYGANGQVGWIDDYLFDEDLVLVVEDETFIGRIKPFSYIVKGKSWVNNHAHVLRPLGGISVDYLNLCLQYYNFIPLTSGTTARRKLTQRGLMTAKFWLAPHNEQHRIVAKVDELMALCDQLKSRIAQAGQLQKKLADAVVEQAIAS